MDFKKIIKEYMFQQYFYDNKIFYHKTKPQLFFHMRTLNIQIGLNPLDYIVLCSYLCILLFTRHILLFFLSGNTTRRFVGHTKDVLSVAFSADNRQIVSGSRDKTIKLWNTLGVCKYTIQVINSNASY